MQADILYRPSYSMAVVNLAPHEAIRAEVGSLVGMTEGINVRTGTEGGVLAGLSRALLGGESFFMNVFEAPDWGGQINLAPSLPGDMIILQLENESLLIQSGSFVAASLGITIDTKWAGARTFFASEGFVMLRARGTGLLILSSYGAIHPIELQAGQRYTANTGYLVSFTEGIGFKVRPVGGVRTTLFSGEGLVVDLTGPGRVYMQTRSQDRFLSWLAMPPRDPEEEKR